MWNGEAYSKYISLNKKPCGKKIVAPEFTNTASESPSGDSPTSLGPWSESDRKPLCARLGSHKNYILFLKISARKFMLIVVAEVAF